MNRLEAAGVLTVGLGTVAGSVAVTLRESAVVGPAVVAVCVGVAVVVAARATAARASSDPNR